MPYFRITAALLLSAALSACQSTTPSSASQPSFAQAEVAPSGVYLRDDLAQQIGASDDEVRCGEPVSKVPFALIKEGESFNSASGEAIEVFESVTETKNEIQAAYREDGELRSARYRLSPKEDVDRVMLQQNDCLRHVMDGLERNLPPRSPLDAENRAVYIKNQIHFIQTHFAKTEIGHFSKAVVFTGAGYLSIKGFVDILARDKIGTMSALRAAPPGSKIGLFVFGTMAATSFALFYNEAREVYDKRMGLQYIDSHPEFGSLLAMNEAEYRKVFRENPELQERIFEIYARLTE